jgi:hypothetical protein
VTSAGNLDQQLAEPIETFSHYCPGVLRTREDVTMSPTGLTAKLTAIFANRGGRRRTVTDSGCSFFILRGRPQTLADVKNAVFKTVCGALLRRPGWVRFPSIPANSSDFDSQDDSHSGALACTSASIRGRFGLAAAFCFNSHKLRFESGRSCHRASPNK